MTAPGPLKANTVPHKPLIDRRVLRYLIAVAAVLTVLDVVNYAAGTPFESISLFVQLGRDNSVPAWYSSILLALGAFLSLECREAGASAGLGRDRTFLLIAGLLLLMSCDEVARFHEIIGKIVADRVGLSARDFADRAAWVWLGGPVVIGLFIACATAARRVLSRVERSFRFFALGFALIVLGGVLLEATVNWLNHAELQRLWDAETVVEEVLELAGTISICHALIIWRDGVRSD